MPKLSTSILKLAALLVLAVLPLAGRAQFAPVVTFSTGSSSAPYSVAAADVNGDGKPDLLTANNGTHEAGVLLNTTAAGAAVPSFAPVTAFSTGSGSRPYSIAAADVNGDGRPDLLTANNGTNSAGVLLNTTAPGGATPSFAPVATFFTSSGASPQSIAAADVNGDGRPDLLTANSNADETRVLLNVTAAGAATPSFAPAVAFSTGGGSRPTGIAAADVNGDGRPDLLTANNDAVAVGVRLNTAAAGAARPAFGPLASFATGSGYGPRSIAAADVNGDGRPDLLTANPVANAATVLLNVTAAGAATPSFAPAAVFATGSSSRPYGVVAADVNGDGRPDLLTANYSGNAVGVLLNTTAAGATAVTFAPVAVFSSGSGSQPYGLAVADVNGDGRPDLLTANQYTDTAGILLNTGTYLVTATASLLAPATLAPNPTTGAFTLTLPAVPGAATATATLLNALEQVVSTRTLALEATGTTVAYAPAGLAAGVYALRVQAAGQTTTLRLVIE